MDHQKKNQLSKKNQFTNYLLHKTLIIGLEVQLSIIGLEVQSLIIGLEVMHAITTKHSFIHLLHTSSSLKFISYHKIHSSKKSLFFFF